MTYTTWYVVAHDYPTKGLVDDQRVEQIKFAITGTEKVNGQTMFVVRPLNSPKQAELKAEVPVPKPEPVKKPESKPEIDALPKVTLTPTKDGIIYLGSAQFVVATAVKEPEVRANWLKGGQLKALTAATEVEVVSRDKDFSKVKLDGKDWVVESKWLPTPAK